MPGGESVITTTTHAFVKLVSPNQSWLRRRVADWILRAMESLAGSKGLRIQAGTPAVVEARAGLGGTNSPVGTVVWLAGTDRKVGTITTTYDPDPSRLLPYPDGFPHDLSLITDENLPLLASPPGMPSISGWGSYAAALDGGPLFVCRLEFVSGVWKKLEGRGMSREAQEAVALGCDYTWNRRALSQNASILWRTNSDSDSALGFSGSVLCLGRITDATARAIVFQNYESPLISTQVARDVKGALELGATFKGGFLLPPEVRFATIEVATDLENRALPHSQPATKEAVEDDSLRRQLTSP
ncbi:MAG: hypothetical protein M1826_004454 [Phylliscum demangeonii]|nr:MAG: hypothetical protein M1826_004454 [Phylliscum demangeonii]